MELDGYASACCDLDLWPFDVISISQSHVHTWPNYGEISSNSYEDIVFIRYRMVIACCDLDLWPLILKASQHIYEPKCICYQNWVKFPSLVCEIWCSQGFRVLPAMILAFLTLKCNQHIYEPSYTCCQNWVKLSSLVFEICCSQGFRDAQTHALSHALTHGWTDPNTICLRYRFSTVTEA